MITQQRQLVRDVNRRSATVTITDAQRRYIDDVLDAVEADLGSNIERAMILCALADAAEERHRDAAVEAKRHEVSWEILARCMGLANRTSAQLRYGPLYRAARDAASEVGSHDR